MRVLWLVTIVCLASGCAGRKAGREGFSQKGKPDFQKLIVTAETGLAGQVVKVNLSGRYVVLTFPVGQIPAIGQNLSLYRRGLKTGEVRVTGPRLDDSAVADLTAGDARIGDEARDK